MARTRRRKKRTHLSDGDGGRSTSSKNLSSTSASASSSRERKVPTSLVALRGPLAHSLLPELSEDLKKMLLPHTLSNLRTRRSNTLKDFVQVTGPLGVSHMVLLSATSAASYMRIARTPHGPTVTFKIESYALTRDVVSVQRRPRAPSHAFTHPPLVVLHGFKTKPEDEDGEAVSLASVTLQNMFPAIDVRSARLHECRRVLCCSYDRETKRIQLRHYAITCKPVGASKAISNFLGKDAGGAGDGKLPDLSKYGDVSEAVAGVFGGYGSESEADEDARVILPQDYPDDATSSARRMAGKAGYNRRGEQSAVKVHELGPRLEMSIMKVEEGVCSGTVLFHQYISKTEEEAQELEERKMAASELKAQRKAEQEANVAAKQAARDAKKREKAARRSGGSGGGGGG
ncbi:ribosome biogenesis protein SSF1/2 [Pycnococcus provasolii]